MRLILQVVEKLQTEFSYFEEIFTSGQRSIARVVYIVTGSKQEVNRKQTQRSNLFPPPLVIASICCVSY